MKGDRKRLIAVVTICAVVILAAVIGIIRYANHSLPTRLYLYGDMAEMTSKKDVRSVKAYFWQGSIKRSCYATIKLQGTSSLNYDKKNYTIKFYKDADCEKKRTVDVGWGAASEYCLKANWIDNTHTRNVVTAQLAAEVQGKYGVMEQAPCNGLVDGFPVEVYINGEFHGIYTWNIPKADWMFGMDEDDPNHIVMCGENWESAAVFYELPNWTSWSVEVGLENEETMAKFTRVADFILNSSDEDFKAHFDEYLDLDSALNYYILVEFAYLPDNRGKNMLMATYDGKIWYPSLYDLDTSWGASCDGLQLYDYENEATSFSANNLGRRLEKLFPQELHDRYFALREEILTKDHVLDLFYTFEKGISQASRDRETQRWGNKIPGYPISQIEEYLDVAIPRLDQKYKSLIQ